MAVFRVEKTKNYTVMSNYHLRDKQLSLKTKGLLSVMLSLPEDWDYTEIGLGKICGEGRDSIRKCLQQLEEQGYLVRKRLRDENGRMGGTEYTIYESPENKGFLPISENPTLVKPTLDKPILAKSTVGKPTLDKPVLAEKAQLNINKINIKKPNTEINQSINPKVKQLFMEDGWIDGENETADKTFETYRKIIMENVSYDLFSFKEQQAEKKLDEDLITLEEYETEKAMYNTKTLDRIIGYMLDIICGMSREPVSVNGNLIPVEMVKSKLLKIDFSQMKQVVKEINTNPGIKNTKNYSISMLYNS